MVLLSGDFLNYTYILLRKEVRKMVKEWLVEEESGQGMVEYVSAHFGCGNRCPDYDRDKNEC